MRPLFKLQESKRYPGLFVRKYTKKVFWDNLWHTDPTLLESRGHVFTADGTQVVNPFTKIFNRHENHTDIPRDHNCLWIEKINGFMAAVTYVPQVDKVVLSTTGSLDSEFVDLAFEKIPEMFIKFVCARGKEYDKLHLPHKTWLFEIVHEKDPHIIQHEPGAYLIGSRNVGTNFAYDTGIDKESDLDAVAEMYDMYRPLWGTDRFSDIVESSKKCAGEGYVVYDLVDRKTVLKLKSPTYLVTKFLGRAKKEKIMAIDYKREFDEEFYHIVEKIRSFPEYFDMKEQEKIEFVRENIYVHR